MESQIFIRTASHEDWSKLGPLKLQSSLGWGDHIDELLALPEARYVPAAHVPFVIVAELAGEIVGFATVLSGENALQAELEDLFVAPNVWRRGVGAQLLAEAERRAVALGAHALHVIASERARAFYEASGFRMIGMVATDFAPAPEMHKDLCRFSSR
ncbi:GNAT family N-acetyltransferase [Chelativorans salis]|uniref:GNAT family N-acetyltransferase n=1 Tax=Chelativorans salis TaxID=2978478 RepID=A0ABT2LXB2_9HYPH|nr:GNAT family N-acetyltransferase [Chelativorans sp. EGI FJ00035]MCT7378507.1 GNAT family N-acetyltransferase [Chelativorans sp. EGI FJ00035]